MPVFPRGAAIIWWVYKAHKSTPNQGQTHAPQVKGHAPQNTNSALQPKADAPQFIGHALEQKMNALQKKGHALQVIGHALEQKRDALQKKGRALQLFITALLFFNHKI